MGLQQDCHARSCRDGAQAQAVMFSASVFPSHVAPTLQASLVWNPQAPPPQSPCHGMTVEEARRCSRASTGNIGDVGHRGSPLS